MVIQARSLALLALFLVLAAALPRASLAQDGEEFDDDDDEAARAAAEEIAAEAAEEDIPERPDHLLTDIPPASPHVSARSVFLPYNSPTDSLPTFIVEHPLEVLLSVYNADGNRPFSIWGVTGSVNSAWNKYDQNFTLARSNATLSPGHEMTIAYTFSPSAHLVSREYQVSLTVFYHRYGEDDQAGINSMYSATTFFNQTLHIHEREGEIDNRMFYLGLLFLIGAVVGGILGRGAIAKAIKGNSSGARAKAPVTSAIETGTKAQANVEWIPEHNLRSRTTTTSTNTSATAS